MATPQLAGVLQNACCAHARTLTDSLVRHRACGDTRTPDCADPVHFGRARPNTARWSPPRHMACAWRHCA